MVVTRGQRSRALNGTTTDQGTPTTRQEIHAVVGGGGYPGFHLGLALLTRGHDVRLVDVREPLDDVPEGAHFMKADVRNMEEIKSAIEGSDCVYHLASYGMSGREQLNKKLIDEVNIQGTKNVIEACLGLGISRLVYTSTYNVVFGGQEIKNGDESLPYFPVEKHPDHYSRTKALAEMEILAANGKPLEKHGKDDRLRTCALRLAGVYGPGEQRHLPRIVDMIERGLFAITFGKKDSLVEFLHVDNMAQAHVLAGEALTEHNQHVAAGQAYFISDDKPVNNFEFFRPLIEELGYKYPQISIPIPIMYFIAFLTEMLHSIVGPIYNFQPFLTRAEIFKTGVTHYFDISKAKKELGYKPTIQNDLSTAVQWFLERGRGKYASKKKPSSKLARFIRDVFLVVIFVSVLMSFLPRVD